MLARTPPAVKERLLTPSKPIDLALTVGRAQRGPIDPTMLVTTEGIWRATRTSDGPATAFLRRTQDGIHVRAWGPGASWVVEAAPAWVGWDDDPGALKPKHAVVEALHRRFRGLRLGRTGTVMEALVPTIIDQKVTGKEAWKGYRRLVRSFGEPAPGPASGLFVPPAAADLAGLPYHAFHPLGIERRRADTIRRACARAAKLEEAATMPFEAARARLMAIPGIGAWTAAEVAIVALGDPDAVSVGDYHLKNHVAWVLAGEPRADDARMLELLEPYRGQRARVIRLIECGGEPPPRYGPRRALRSIAAM